MVGDGGLLLLVYTVVLAPLGVLWGAEPWRIRRYRRLVARSIDDPMRRREAIAQLSEARVLIRSRLLRPPRWRFRAREEAELRLCLAELLAADDRPEDAQKELEQGKLSLPRRRRTALSRISREIEVRRALARGDAQGALGRSSDEVWRLLSAAPQPLLAAYAETHPDEEAAQVARRILDRSGAHR